MAGDLPEGLWPEVYRAAVYLANRIPRRMYDWKTPFENFFGEKPTYHHLKVYGCKAFALTPTASLKMKRLNRLAPKAWIGYLVGYSSNNQYRIWLPTRNKVIVTRDVHFNEDNVFDGQLQTLKLDAKMMDPALLARVLEQASRGDLVESDVDLTYESEDQLDPFASRSPEELSEEESSDDENSFQEDSCDNIYTSAIFAPMLTPPDTPPASLLTTAFSGKVHNSAEEAKTLNGRPSKCQTWEYAFHTAQRRNVVLHVDGVSKDRIDVQRDARKAIKASRKKPHASPNKLTRKQITGRLWRDEGIHRRELEPPPKSWRSLEAHSMRDAFKDAEKEHLSSHDRMNSWSILQRSLVPDGAQILDCMWVYVYKFDKAGWLVKCKARLVVRGDQQRRENGADTYAATLAGRSFKALLAIATRFDLELIQYDAVNAFVHAKLDEVVYMRMPPGYGEKGKILTLHKALYGLRKSPLLWQRDFKGTLEELGFSVVPHEPCCMSNDGILVFFYVDDIVFAFRNHQRKRVEKVVKGLKKRYQLTGGDDLQWFLGMEVTRDRLRRYSWISQKTHLEKLGRENGAFTHPKTPMTTTELLPFEGQVSPQEIKRYQQKVGSLMYVAVTTRPDVAFAVSRLARFLVNPGPSHHKAADRVIAYLKDTSELALQFGGEDDLEVASDASFADNTRDRKSSQAFAIKLFGGMIAWRANKQDTVTTSTTEAELLALSQTAKEALYIVRLLKDLTVTLDSSKVRIQCDNQQTIRLVNSELATLSTKLRHGDIHNHWLRQECSRENIEVVYTESAKIMADSLTKPLQNEAFQRFVSLMGLVRKYEFQPDDKKDEDRDLEVLEDLKYLFHEHAEVE